MKNTQLHDGHRDRLREKYKKEGLTNMPEHEVLELLMFYSIPRGNTNELAHQLINKFGSLANVFEADVDALMQVKGIGKVTASLISFQRDMCKRYFESKRQINNMVLTRENAGEIIKSLFYGEMNELFYMVALDGRNRIINKDMICEGTTDSVHVYTRKVISRALDLNARKVIFAHNHPNGILVPSEEDRKTTQMLKTALAFIDVAVEDHIIVAHDRYCSMKWDFKAI